MKLVGKALRAYKSTLCGDGGANAATPSDPLRRPARPHASRPLPAAPPSLNAPFPGAGRPLIGIFPLGVTHGRGPILEAMGQVVSYSGVGTGVGAPLNPE